MKQITCMAAAFALAAFPGAADTVTIGTIGSYDVGGFTVDPAALQGFEKALGDALCQRAGLSCEWKTLPGEQIWTALEAGEIDAVMAGVSMEAELGANAERTMPYLMPDPFLHIGLPGTTWHIEGAVIGHLSNPAVTAYARTTGATFIEYPTLEEALAAVRSGQVLSFFGEREALVPIAEATDGELTVVGNRDDIKLKPGVAMVFRADDLDLRFSFEDQIYAMSQDGSLNAMTETWFGADAALW